jgi:iron complex outermembrane receptor protein
MIAYFAYGKGYQFNSWNGQSSAYTNNKALFRAAGISFNRLWDSLKPERYDNFDFGFRYKSEMFSVSPVFYYSLDKNKTVTIYDPVVGAPYLQSNTDATSCGAEFEFTFRPPMSGSNSLLFYLSSSYNNFQFDHNTRNASNNIVQSKGKQMADTPKNMTKLGVTYSIYGFSITPMVRYLSSRFADIENKQRVEGYPLADLHASYSPREGIFKDLTLSFSIVNLFDKRYIGLINTSDFSLSNSTSFYPGASRTVMGGISMRIDALVRGIAK